MSSETNRRAVFRPVSYLQVRQSGPAHGRADRLDGRLDAGQQLWQVTRGRRHFLLFGQHEPGERHAVRVERRRLVLLLLLRRHLLFFLQTVPETRTTVVVRSKTHVVEWLPENNHRKARSFFFPGNFNSTTGCFLSETRATSSNITSIVHYHNIILYNFNLYKSDSIFDWFRGIFHFSTFRMLNR